MQEEILNMTEEESGDTPIVTPERSMNQTEPLKSDDLPEQHAEPT